MAYIDGNGQVVSAPLSYRIKEFFVNFYLALVLFFSTLFYPTTIRKLQPNSSLKSRRNLAVNGGGGGGGGGGGTTASGRGFGGGGSATLSDLNTGPVLRPLGGCSTCG